MKLKQNIADLSTPNHITAYERVVDALGHVSIRYSLDPETFLLSRLWAATVAP